MSSAAWALQQAVFAALESAPGLEGVPVFDAVPRGSAFPYIVIGDGDEAPDGDHALTIRIWSRAGGHRESKQLAALVRSALETTPPALDGHALVDLRFSSADYARASDGETWRASLRFKALTEPQ